MQKVAKKIDMDSYQKKKRRRRILRDWAVAIVFVIFIILAFVFVYVTSDESNGKVEDEFGILIQPALRLFDNDHHSLS